MHPITKKIRNINEDNFLQILEEYHPKINFNNTQYLKEFYNFYISDGLPKTYVEFERKCRSYFKYKLGDLKSGSESCFGFWVSRGYSEEDSKEIVSKIQRNKSNLNIDYWVKKGYSKCEANKKVSELQSKNSKKRYKKYNKEELKSQSVWSYEYWTKKGYSLEDAKLEVHKRNAGKLECWGNEKDYQNHLKKLSKGLSTRLKENPELFYGSKSNEISISKEELDFFKHIEDLGIIHKTFKINTVLDEDISNNIILYDGYLKTNKGIILIEYDGLYWHKGDYDELKDLVCLKLRSDVLGIIRVSDKYFKNNKKQVKNDIKNGIEKIKDKECSKIRYY